MLQWNVWGGDLVMFIDNGLNSIMMNQMKPPPYPLIASIISNLLPLTAPLNIHTLQTLIRSKHCFTIKGNVDQEQSGYQDMINEDRVGGWNGVEFLSSSVSSGRGKPQRWDPGSSLLWTESMNQINNLHYPGQVRWIDFDASRTTSYAKRGRGGIL